MKLALISDVHGQFIHLDVPTCDVLLCSGDITCSPYSAPVYEEITTLRAFNHWARRLVEKGRVKHVVTIAGNHDRVCEKLPEDARLALEDVTYLQDEAAVVAGVSIYGTPWTPRFYDWGFQTDGEEHAHSKFSAERVRGALGLLPGEGARLDVLLCHGPPYGILDKTEDARRVGCKNLRREIEKLRPRLVVFGHIHGGRGIQILDGVTYVNAASLDERYDAKNIRHPIVIELATEEEG